METIRLALELRADWMLMDDRRAVAYARSRGLRVAPVIAIYLMAKRRSLIVKLRPKVDLLRRAGFRLTDEHYREVLRAAGE
jgi:predicted nucleic acid-binding protein